MKYSLADLNRWQLEQMVTVLPSPTHAGAKRGGVSLGGQSPPSGAEQAAGSSAPLSATWPNCVRTPASRQHCVPVRVRIADIGAVDFIGWTLLKLIDIFVLVVFAPFTSRRGSGASQSAVPAQLRALRWEKRVSAPGKVSPTWMCVKTFVDQLVCLNRGSLTTGFDFSSLCYGKFSFLFIDFFF